MSFNVSADAYLRFMGRYSEPLAAQFADLAGVRPGSGRWTSGAGPERSRPSWCSRLGASAVCASGAGGG